MANALRDKDRKAIHDFALDARELLMTDIKELLEGVYGVYADGQLEDPEKLPQVQNDPESRETYQRIKQYLEDEVEAGLEKDFAVQELIKEAAFTHLNRFVAFKMMEARDLIRGTIDKGPESNGFKFYLAEEEHADQLNLYQQGKEYEAYRQFILWQSGNIAREIRVLFDPDNLVSRLFPQNKTLSKLLEKINIQKLDSVWKADETIGWVYQYFNEPELQAAFEKVSSGSEKFQAEDIPSATQLFTPHWIVKFIVQNTLGRLWAQMHPDSRLIDSDILDYLVPLKGEIPGEPLRPVKEISVLDPACGGMHFGLVAFDLLIEMYKEEIERAGDPGWPEKPSIHREEEIPESIIENNIFGIDIDLRAVQLSALALYLKAKTYNPDALITRSNLANADIRPLNGKRLAEFIKNAEFKRPIYERLLKALWEKLQDVIQLGSLLRLEKELKDLIEQERDRYKETPLFAGMEGEFEKEAEEKEFWDVIFSQIIQGLDDFAREQFAEGLHQNYFAGEATKGVRLLDVMLDRYDVVVTNPPYLSRRKMNKELKKLVADGYSEGKHDLYAAFMQRCLELSKKSGYVGMLTMHSFMFIKYYEDLREKIRQEVAIQSMAHCGPALFDVGNPGTLQTTAFTFRKEKDIKKRNRSIGTYFRLVHEVSGDDKQSTLEKALLQTQEIKSNNKFSNNVFHVRQIELQKIPRAPWAYWVSNKMRELFSEHSSLNSIAERPNPGCTSNNFRYLRTYWEVCQNDIGPYRRWIYYSKGGGYKKWYGNLEIVIDWSKKAREYYSEDVVGKITDEEYRYKDVAVYSSVSSKGFSVRYFPPLGVYDRGGPAILFDDVEDLFYGVGLLNSELYSWFLGLLNPSINYQGGDIDRLPIPKNWEMKQTNLNQMAVRCIYIAKNNYSLFENGCEFVGPPLMSRGRNDYLWSKRRVREMQNGLNDIVYDLFEVNKIDRASIKAEILGEPLPDGRDNSFSDRESQPAGALDPIKQTEINIRWISYAVGIVLGRFQPGILGSLGSAVYRQEDFAVGSLPAPDEDELNELVGPPDQFAYVDDEGGRHVFSRESEEALRDLTVENGITVFDEGHPRDLPTLVEEALILMLGAEDAREAINEGAGGDLRAFLTKKYFTDYHVKWYSVSRRKAPIYWPLQSSELSYGFLIFHEKFERDTLYVLQRDYLDYKINGLEQRISDLASREEGLEGSARKEVRRQLGELRRELEEITDFARKIERIAENGYQPESDWIDDGVILRLAPLWELIPIWQDRPKKRWEELQEGEYDWSHIAMNYWPERVKEKCKENKSYAIAHGHEEWYQDE